eukprot:UN29400
MSSDYNDSNPFQALTGQKQPTIVKTTKETTVSSKRRSRKKKRGKKRKNVEDKNMITNPKMDQICEIDEHNKTSDINSQVSTKIANNQVGIHNQKDPLITKGTSVQSEVKKVEGSLIVISPKSSNSSTPSTSVHAVKRNQKMMTHHGARVSSVARKTDKWQWMSKYKDGMMFVCNSETYEECLRIKLLGLPRQYLRTVASLKPDTSALFLFNMSTRLLYGVFEPTESGGENLNRTAWNRTNERTGSRYPAQVPIRPVFSFTPLNESAFRSMFHDGNRIRKLDEQQVKE